ncbi:MAG: prolipoprotein diacylglyceryl transferase [Cyclobacteriaceae bacterium]|nr:prolipoprotein diacylglyceryl transferase [Cyclobacteriaceae bacterium]
MHPVFFEFDTPGFLQGFLPETISIYFYGFFIACGAILGTLYAAYESKKQFAVKMETIQTLVILIVLAAIVGGKVFMVFEDPAKYLHDPAILLRNFSNGFVFYGSLLFAIPLMLWFFKAHKLPTLAMLDIMAVSACIVHGFGRIGCFMAGCCYGTPHQGALSVCFTDPRSAAEPLHTPLHPTQLYSAVAIFTILAIILFAKSRKRFDGQLFMLYLMLYAVARTILELFRGDLERGYLIDGVLSNSQFISLLVFLAALSAYILIATRQSKQSARRK